MILLGKVNYIVNNKHLIDQYFILMLDHIFPLFESINNNFNNKKLDHIYEFLNYFINNKCFTKISSKIWHHYIVTLINIINLLIFKYHNKFIGLQLLKILFQAFCSKIYHTPIELWKVLKIKMNKKWCNFIIIKSEWYKYLEYLTIDLFINLATQTISYDTIAIKDMIPFYRSFTSFERFIHIYNYDHYHNYDLLIHGYSNSLKIILAIIRHDIHMLKKFIKDDNTLNILLNIHSQFLPSFKQIYQIYIPLILPLYQLDLNNIEIYDIIIYLYTTYYQFF